MASGRKLPTTPTQRCLRSQEEQAKGRRRSAAVCISVFLFSQSREAVSLELSKLNWTAPTLGLAVVALEVGYILTYRAGWKINTASLVTNIALAILLLFIGFLFYGEPITGRKLLGVVICGIGLFFLIK